MKTQTRNEWRAEAESLLKELGLQQNLDGMKRADMADLVERLRAEKATRAAKALAANPTPEAPELNTKPVIDGVEVNRSRGGPPRYPYQVAGGKQLKCRRGVLPAGAEVRAADVGGQQELEALVRAGNVLRGPQAPLPRAG